MGRQHVALFTLALASVGCTQKQDPAPVPAEPSATASSAVKVLPMAEVASCTAETTLEPGVPGSPGSLISDSVNPNGTSELALLMRTMRDDVARVRELVTAGKPAKLPYSHHRIRCSWPTSRDMRSPPFDALAGAHLKAIDHFNQAGGKQALNGVVQGCVNCHNKKCGGPLSAIRALGIPDTDKTADAGQRD